MDSDDDHHDDHQDGDKDEEGKDKEEQKEDGEEPISLTGFLFGNIDEKGKLETDVLDEVRKTFSYVAHAVKLHVRLFCAHG